MSSACEVLRLAIAAYADDELGVDAALVVERHLDGCGRCRRAVARQRQLADGLRSLHPIVDPEEGFEARVRAAVVGPANDSRRALAAGAVVLLVAGALVWSGAPPIGGRAHEARTAELRRSADGAPLVTAAAAIHRRLDARALRLEVASGDVAGVNAWLGARLPFTARIAAPESSAIALEGAAVVELGARPAGLVRYRMQGRAVSLFLLSAPAWEADALPVRVGAMDFRVFRRPGLDAVGWSHASLSYLLISADGLATGDACAVCHGGDGRRVIADFVRAVAGRAANA